MTEYANQRYAANPQRRHTAWKLNLHHRYGITPEDYQRMLEAQNGVCALCGEPEVRLYKGKPTRLAVDHCHNTSQVRSLLCHACNTGLGCFKDSQELLKKAGEYLAKSHQAQVD